MVKTNAIGLGVIIALIILTAMLFTQVNSVNGSAPPGLPAFVSSSSNQTIASTARLLFATSSCSARTISTRAEPLMLGFGEFVGFVPSAITGVYQAASTTVTYDSGQYGCGAVRVISGTVNSSVVNAIESI